jgi:hypothetical protein
MLEAKATSAPFAGIRYDILERKPRPTLRRDPTSTLEFELLQGLNSRGLAFKR